MNLSSKVISLIKRYDLSILATVIAIFLIGVLNLYSALSSNPSAHMAQLYKTQIMWFSLSMLIAIVTSFIHPKNLYRFAWFIYGFNVILLLVVLLFGKMGMGAQRWIVLGPLRLQPSETMKIALVIALARWYSKVDPDKPINFRKLIIPSIIAFIPAVLVIIQPDLGTGLLLLLVFLSITFYRQLKWKTIGIIGILAILAGTFMYNFGLKEYQRKRIITFIDPYADAKGSGYNAIQSEIAIGAGRLTGKGFKKSSQASLQYLPENHTDFVFSVYNEEHGFIGSLILISLFIILLMRMIWISSVVVKFFDSIIAIGVMAIFFWHTFINMGMVMGLMPIVGLPLPLMSYGGSSLLTFGVCTGVITSVSNSRNLF